jgi:hypothetical protein
VHFLYNTRSIHLYFFNYFTMVISITITNVIPMVIIN